MEANEKQSFEAAQDTPKEKVPFTGSKLTAESEFKSPYWALSYDFPYNPDPLCSGNDYSIYDEMVDDDQVKSVITIKKDMVVNSGWKINSENEEVKQYVTDCFLNINDRNVLGTTFEDTLRDILSSYEYGFSLTEPVYKIEKGKYVYSELNTRAPHSFKFDVDKYGKVLSIKQSCESGELDFQPSTFLHYVCQVQFGNPYGKSDLRAAYKAWKAKNFFIKFFAIYVERFAAGTLVGKYPNNYTITEISNFHSIIKTIQNTTALAIPEDATIEWLQNNRDASDVYLKGIDYYNQQIARSVLMPDLLGLGGTKTGGGSYALGKEQFGLFLGTIKKDRDSLARKITSRLVRPLAMANFGDIKCEFEFLPYAKEDILEYLKLWLELVKVPGYIVSDEELTYFKAVIGFPDVEKDGFRVALPKTPEKDKKDIDPEAKEDNKYVKNGRELTRYEQKVDFGRVGNYLDTQGKAIIPELTRLAKDIYNSIIEKVKDSGMRPEVVNKIEPKHIRPMQIALRDYYLGLANDIGQQTAKEMFPDRKYTKNINPEYLSRILEQEAIKAVTDFAADISKNGLQLMLNAIKSGASEQEIVKILKIELPDKTEKWITTTIRTKTTEIFNRARKAYWETDELAKQIVVAYQWSAILDDRTSAICEYMDGKIFEIGELSNMLSPPAHFNCRSILVPITKFEEYKPNPDKDFRAEKLQSLGGGFIREYVRDNPQADNLTLQIISKSITNIGDIILLETPGIGRKIVIKAIHACNVNPDEYSIIGFREEYSESLKYKTLLPKAGGTFQRIFKDEYWELPENTGFVLNVMNSGNYPGIIELTVEYDVVGG